MHESKKIVVIGGVAAGMKAAAKARRCDARAEITVLAKGELVSYGACGLPYYVAGEVKEMDELIRTSAGYNRDAVYFRETKNIDIRTQTTATYIDRSAKLVLARGANGEEYQFPYDKLVIATGATPIKISLPGKELSNIMSLWYPSEAQAIWQGIAEGRYKKAVIIGAGLVGVEMADALVKRGIEVTLVENKNQVFPAILDAEIAAAIGKYLQSKGVNLITGERVLQFNGNSAVSEVVTDKQVILADLVITAIGVKPNIELAASAGLEIGAAGGILVDEYLRTSDPNIYAGGDCVENIHLISGRKVLAPMGSVANKHGRIIGENICGGECRFRGVLSSVIVKVFDMNVGKVGLSEREAIATNRNYVTAIVTAFDKLHYMPDARPLTIKLLADRTTRKVIGAQAYGKGDIAKRLDVVAMALTLGGSVDDLFAADLTYAPPYNSPIDPIAVSANVLMNKLNCRFNGISPLLAKEYAANTATTFLDVRTTREVSRSCLAGCKQINIPLHELRHRLGEIDSNSDIITFCSFGLRGYEAALMLQAAGFTKVSNLEGGTIAWPFEIHKKR